MTSTSLSGRRSVPFHYRLGDLHLASDLSLPQLSASKSGEPDLHVGRARACTCAPDSKSWYMRWDDWRGHPWLSFARQPGGFLLHFHGMADFWIDSRGGVIRYWTKKTPQETFRHLLLDQVLPLVMNLRGGEALHAALVSLPAGTFAVCGPSGSGKSTLAASFFAAGHRLLADDCALLRTSDRGVEVAPLYPGLRIAEDTLKHLFGRARGRRVAHYSAKRRVHVETLHCASGCHPLKRIYVLDDSKDRGAPCTPSVVPLARAEALIELVRSTFRFDIEDPKMLSRQFSKLADVVAAVPVRRLLFPHDFELLSSVQAAIRADLKTDDVPRKEAG